MQRRLGRFTTGLYVATLCCFISVFAHAQGVLTVTPGKGLSTTTGTGQAGYSGDGSAALTAALNSPSAVAYDASGNLYIADAANDVIRKVSTSGTITTIAGAGEPGFGGDGGPATDAYLDTPTGVAVDASGNIYIADSHNQRIRKVTGTIISTVAGTGVMGFSGDGGDATAAKLALPSAVAADASGNLLIADTNNHRIRKVAGGIISSVAGNGEELYAGDGGPATAASLDLPIGIAVDATGQIYIADSHNQRIRVVDTNGNITTFAGNGNKMFSGAFNGDGPSATAASLAKPNGVSVDASGNVYIADTGNQRIRQVSSGAIATVAGNGAQGFGGDGSPATEATLNNPRNVVADANGNAVIADRLNQRVRSISFAAFTFANDGVGVTSSAQQVTLSNSGTEALSVTSITFSGPFSVAAGGSCPAAPISLAANQSCTQNVSYLPMAVGAHTGSVTFAGTGIVPQKIALNGTAVTSSTTIEVTSSGPKIFAGLPVTLTATVAPPGLGTPTGSIDFYDGTALLGTVTQTTGSAQFQTSSLAAGDHSITAVYGGDANFAGSTSAAISQMIDAAPDFNLQVASGGDSQSVFRGKTASFNFVLQSQNAAFMNPITLRASGLPPGAIATFTPATITPGDSAINFKMTVQTVPMVGMLHIQGMTSSLAFAVLLLPVIGGRKKSWFTSKIARMMGLVLLFGVLSATVMLTGCGSALPTNQYAITVTGTSTGVTGVQLQHSTTVTLILQNR